MKMKRSPPPTGDRSIDGWTTRRPLHCAAATRRARVVEEIRASDPGYGWQHEAVEVGRCLCTGPLESPTMPLDESVAIMRTLDEIRRQIGLRYPFKPRGADPA